MRNDRLLGRCLWSGFGSIGCAFVRVVLLLFGIFIIIVGVRERIIYGGF